MIVDFSTSTISPNIQTPLCDFALTKVYAYADGTGCSAGFCYDTSIFIGGTDGKLTISTTNATKVGTYMINVTQTVTDAFSKLYKASAAAAGNPAGNQTFDKTLTYTIVIENGCLTSSFNVLTVADLAPAIGGSAT